MGLYPRWPLVHLPMSLYSGLSKRNGQPRMTNKALMLETAQNLKQMYFSFFNE